jgi:poly(hydroxyalkanoate) depolymerase family esterase
MAKFRSSGDFGFPHRWQKFLRMGGNRSRVRGAPDGSRLREVFRFGSNPGNLRMFTYRPRSQLAHGALVVVLHGCIQTASGYDRGAGWSELADEYGFALLLPEQQHFNNPNGCFNWFLSEHSRRDQGEPLSILQMIEKCVIDFGIDRERIFVTGLSAGGAMTSTMLACYPEVFAGGAIIAGLPYGAAANVQQAFVSMRQSPARSPREWGNHVRNASSHRGPWPRVSVWHGDADKTVVSQNATEVLKQWTNVHGLSLSPSLKTQVDGYPREVWLGSAGAELIEAYTISNMAHGTPLSLGDEEGACGAPGPFLLPVGISSSYRIARFFGIAAGRRSRDEKAKFSRSPARTAEGEPVLEGDILTGDDPRWPEGSRRDAPGIGAVINNALRAAGLIKD